MEIKYCPKCHREVYCLTEKDGNILVTQNGKTLFSLNDKSSINIGLSCTSGHTVKLVLKAKDATVVVKEAVPAME